MECRSPHGERGLKSYYQSRLRFVCRLSLPSRGAWIEMCKHRSSYVPCGCRSPHGERGLKFDQIGAQPPEPEVAPLTGSVD